MLSLALRKITRGTFFNAAEWYKLISLLEDNGFDSYNGKYPVGSFRHGQSDNMSVSLNLLYLKKCLKSFLLLGYDEVLVFFNGPTKALIITPKIGFNRVAFNRHKLPFVLTMPVLNEGGEDKTEIKVDLNKGTFGMAASKSPVKIPWLDTSETDTLKAAIEPLETATEFAEASAKKELSSAIEALQVALEFA